MPTIESARNDFQIGQQTLWSITPKSKDWELATITDLKKCTGYNSVIGLCKQTGKLCPTNGYLISFRVMQSFRNTGVLLVKDKCCSYSGKTTIVAKYYCQLMFDWGE